MDHEILEMSDREANSLADKIAEELFTAIWTCALQTYPWENDVTSPMEALGRRVLDVALKKFYQRCCG